MAGPYPILPNGLATTQAIWDTTTSPVVPVGTRAWLPDGRVYYYARNSGVAIVAGNLLQSEAISVDMDDLATNTAVVGDTTVNVTPVGTATFAENDLAGGYLITNSGTTGAGITYRIKSNPATTAATAFNVTLFDPIVVAFNADTTAFVFKNPWQDVVIAASGQAHLAAGVSNVAVGAGSTTKQYFWCQTWGLAAVWNDDTSAAGVALSSGGTAGQVQAAAEGTGVLDQIIGVNMFAAVAADFGPVFLQIAP